MHIFLNRKYKVDGSLLDTVSLKKFSKKFLIYIQEVKVSHKGKDRRQFTNNNNNDHVTFKHTKKRENSRILQWMFYFKGMACFSLTFLFLL